MNATDIIKAIDAALAGDWDRSHRIVQMDERNPKACWVHAVLHKIEGDTWNSKYWYARTQHTYEEWTDTQSELKAIRTELEIDHD